jgi:hypothetical protein
MELNYLGRFRLTSLSRLWPQHTLYCIKSLTYTNKKLTVKLVKSKKITVFWAVLEGEGGLGLGP